MTHKQVVQIAYKWVIKNCGVGFAFKELKSIASEIPDVIAFDSWQSILIEVKVTRSDFLSDKKKPHRAKGMGNWRFYCCPQGLIKKSELPPKWGLIYVNEKGKARMEYDCRHNRVPCEHFGGTKTVTATENWFEADDRSERRIMYSALRRIFIKGHMDCIYDQQNNKLTANDILEKYETDK